MGADQTFLWTRMDKLYKGPPNGIMKTVSWPPDLITKTA